MTACWQSESKDLRRELSEREMVEFWIDLITQMSSTYGLYRDLWCPLTARNRTLNGQDHVDKGGYI